MPTQIIFAPAASGKTAYVVKLARETAVSLQAEVRICVPTGLQAHAWRQQLADAGGALGVHILTFDRLVATCLNEAGQAYTELSDPVLYRLLRQIIDHLPLKHYAPLKLKSGFIQITHQLIAELKAARIYPDQFAAAIGQIGSGPRLQELADIYTAYQQQLQTEAWADRAGLHWLAAEALAERAPNACKNWPVLIVDGFDDFTPSQLTLLKLLADRVGRCIITLPQAKQIAFPRYHKTRQAVEATFGVSGVPLPDSQVPPAAPPALRHLTQHLFGQTGSAAVPHEEALTLREASDRAAEARTALRWLKQQIVWQGSLPEQVALLARDIAPYRPFIQQIAAEFGLPLNLVDGQPLAQSPVIAALLMLLRLHLPVERSAEPSLPRRQVITSWRSPYFSWQNGEINLNPADADTLDAFARQQLVIGGLGQWQAAFAAGAAAQHRPATVDEASEAGEALVMGTAVHQLQAKFTHFLNTTRPPTAATTLREFVQWLETLIGPDPQAPGYTPPPAGCLHIVAQARRNAATAAADVAALRALKDILRGLVWAEEAVGPGRPVDFAYFFTELSGAIAAAHFLLPARADQPGITVANAAQVRGVSFAAVAIMGLSEGSFPATLSEDPFLRDADRHLLRETFGFQLASSTQSAEREFFYEAVTRARQKLLLTRSVLADNGAEWVASPFWEAVRRLVDAAPQSAPSEAVIPLAETASWAEWWESMAAQPVEHPPLSGPNEAVQQQIEAAARIWQIRLARETAVYEGDLSSLAPELTTQFGPDHIWSASRLESYQTCGFLFFLQKILEIEPRPEPVEGLNGRQLGSIYHDIFEQVMAATLPDTTDETAVRDWVTVVAAPILDTAPEREGFRQTAWWSQTRAEIVDKVTRSVLMLSGGDYAFLQAEAAFGMKGPPLIIQNGADSLRLHGFIDRVDQRPDGAIRIIDYKAGGRSAYSAAAFSQGKRLQLPLYALAAQETLGLGPVADGFYWHFQQAEASGFTLEKAEGGVNGAVETAVAHAWHAVHHIRSGQFAPQPPDTGCPTYCPAASFCWQYAPKSW